MAVCLPRGYSSSVANAPSLMLKACKRAHSHGADISIIPIMQPAQQTTECCAVCCLLCVARATVYETLQDAPLLRQIPWAYLMVDEAHRLKNAGSALYSELSGWAFRNKLLVTGTPLQNSMRELWALLNFLEPGRFGAADEFEAAYRVEGAAVSWDWGTSRA